MLVLLVLHSCNKNYGTANVKWINASPDAPAVNVVNTGKVIVNSLSFDSVSNYINVNRENLFFSIEASNQIIGRVSNPQWNENGFYSVYLSDTVGNMGRLILNDAYETPEAGKAMIRFLHLSPDLPGIQLLANGNALFDNRVFTFAKVGTFNGFSSFTTIDAGTYNFAGRYELDNTITDIILANNITFNAGKAYTIYAKGFMDTTKPNSLSLGVVEEQ